MSSVRAVVVEGEAPESEDEDILSQSTTNTKPHTRYEVGRNKNRLFFVLRPTYINVTIGESDKSRF